MCALALPAGGQSFLARADSLYAARRPAEALAVYGEALAADPAAYPVLWKTGRALVDVAKQIEEDGIAARRRRDSLYLEAAGYARAAVRVDSTGADGHFVLALALGQLSRTKGGRERLRYGREVYDQAARALALDPDHPGAHHVIGAWHAEARRLSGATRFVARTLLGAGFLGRASWDSATAHLERAVALRPDYIYHRLDLAEMYLDLERYGDARSQLEAIPALPDTDVMDGRYRQRAAALLREIETRE